MSIPAILFEISSMVFCFITPLFAVLARANGRPREAFRRNGGGHFYRKGLPPVTAIVAPDT